MAGSSSPARSVRLAAATAATAAVVVFFLCVDDFGCGKLLQTLALDLDLFGT
jgi:hypothetical protein